MDTAAIIANKKLPKFITSHPIFTKTKNVEKIFPLIGLKNCSAKVSSVDYVRLTARIWRGELISHFTNTRYWADASFANAIIRGLKKSHVNDFVDGDKVVIPKAMRKLAGIKITNFTDAYIRAKFGRTDDLGWYRRTNSISKPLRITDDMRVVFSSDGSKGVWDIATMSMRGLTSCQSWGGCYKRNLIGSIVDPYCGIIYLTAGDDTKYGSRMVRRALVRYVYDRKTGQPAIMLERIYPSHYSDRVFDHTTFAIFAKFISDRTNMVVFDGSRGCRGYSIPGSKVVQKMHSCGKFADGAHYCLSYRDSNIGYSKKRSTHLKSIKAF